MGFISENRFIYESARKIMSNKHKNNTQQMNTYADMCNKRYI